MKNPKNVLIIVGSTPGEVAGAFDGGVDDRVAWLTRRIKKSNLPCKATVHAGGRRNYDDHPQRRRPSERSRLFLENMDEISVFVVNGLITADMREELEEVFKAGLSVRWFDMTGSLSCPEITLLEHLPGDAIPVRCDLMSPEALAAEITGKFADMAAKLKDGDFYEDCDAGLDDLLGTGMEERDRDVEVEWQKVRDGE